MTPNAEHPGDGSLRVSLTAQDAGTAIGAVAWVLGALEIMKDRGHAEADEEFHDLYESLEPQLNRLAALIAGARSTYPPDHPIHEQIESAYTAVREAFETWIQLTASDTAQVAIGQRIAAALDEGGLGDLDLGGGEASGPP